MSLLERLPPQDVEAEACLISAILHGGAETALAARGVVLPSDFYGSVNGEAFALLLDLVAKGDPCDALALERALAARGTLEAFGGRGRLVELSDVVPSEANATYYARRVREMSRRRVLIRISADALAAGYDLGQETGAVLEAASQGLTELLAATSARADVRFCDLLVREIDRLEAGRPIPGVMTGVADLDRLSNGLQNGSLWLLAARPSVGKTSLAVQIALYVALHGCAVALFSVEMSAEQVTRVALVQTARLDSRRVQAVDLTAEERQRATRAASEISQAPLHVLDCSGMSVEDIRSRARLLRVREWIGLVIVDYLQLVGGGPSKGDDNRVEEISRVSAGFKGLARELDIPVLALSQLNRQSENDSRRPRMSDLRGSGSLEQDADAVLFLHRAKPPDADGGISLVDCELAKNRTGPTGRFRLAFHGFCQRFDGVRPGDEPEHEPPTKRRKTKYLGGDGEERDRHGD